MATSDKSIYVGEVCELKLTKGMNLICKSNILGQQDRITPIIIDTSDIFIPELTKTLKIFGDDMGSKIDVEVLTKNKRAMTPPGLFYYCENDKEYGGVPLDFLYENWWDFSYCDFYKNAPIIKITQDEIISELSMVNFFYVIEQPYEIFSHEGKISLQLRQENRFNYDKIEMCPEYISSVLKTYIAPSLYKNDTL